jgi:hypothetical protein
MITFPCWNCSKNLKASDAHAGRKCRCAHCDSINSIPGTMLSTKIDIVIQNEPEPPATVAPEQYELPTLPAQPPIFYPRTRTHERSVSGLLVVGVIMLILGGLILGYFLVIYDTTVPNYPEWMRRFGAANGQFQDRTYNVGQMNQQFVGRDSFKTGLVEFS